MSGLINSNQGQQQQNVQRHNVPPIKTNFQNPSSPTLYKFAQFNVPINETSRNITIPVKNEENEETNIYFTLPDYISEGIIQNGLIVYYPIADLSFAPNKTNFKQFIVPEMMPPNRTLLVNYENTRLDQLTLPDTVLENYNILFPRISTIPFNEEDVIKVIVPQFPNNRTILVKQSGYNNIYFDVPILFQEGDLLLIPKRLFTPATKHVEKFLNKFNSFFNEEEEKEIEDITLPVPNELKIVIKTGIPGFQSITYKPSLSIKNTPHLYKRCASRHLVKGLADDENKVIFDPLLKLSQSLVNDVPEHIRKREFFNSGLFYSLEQYHGNNKVKNIMIANNRGYIDNNIEVTINTLFSPNSVIYINNRPHVIVDAQWTKGDWKIDTKKKPVELDSSKITDPRLFISINNEEIKKGNEELKQIPDVLKTGPAYVSNTNNTLLQPQQLKTS
jgi:hypothetical protein